MSNPFDDLKEDETDTSESEDSIDSESRTDSKRTDEQPSVAESAASSIHDSSPSETSVEGESADATSDEPLSPAETGPAFEYSEVKQKPFYARTETVNQFENEIRMTIVPKLAEAGLLDEETREIHDAVLRLANEQPERIAELVLEERRQSGSQ
ncbi:hypothetical protein [Natrinema soli]|uniref:Uncharacterized protein n=1 Tax=Natrinema soli TaxID=1930624 RepID=A0ABD5SV59_9EURY|nr:hypothetical protein [Natrinema soli]